jgi:hypothetical protein
MFITRKILLAISVLVSGIILVFVFQNRRNKKWFDTHTYIHEIDNSGSYTVKRITDERLRYYYNDEFLSEEEKNDYSKERIGGYIFYDTALQTFWVEATGYIISEDEDIPPDEYSEWINIYVQGNVITRKKEVDSLARKNLVILKNEITNFYDWDETSLFYVQHFAREKFIWNSLNPLRVYGNPTGGSPNTYWEGFAYFKLQMQKSVLQFKTRTRTTDRSYYFSIDLYRVPDKNNSGREMAFVYVDYGYINWVDKGLYLITRVNH